MTEELWVAMIHVSMHEAHLELVLRDTHTTIDSDGPPPVTATPAVLTHDRVPRVLGGPARQRAGPPSGPRNYLHHRPQEPPSPRSRQIALVPAPPIAPQAPSRSCWSSRGCRGRLRGPKTRGE